MEKSPRPRRRRRLLKVAVGLLLVLVVLAMALPSIVSGTAGRDYLLRKVNAALAGTLHATDLDLSWTGGQALGGVELRDPSGKRVLKFDRLRTDAGLLALLTGDYDLGRVVLTGLELDLVRDENGRLNLGAALERQGKAEEEEPRSLDEVLRDLENALPPSLRVDVEAPGACVRYRDPALDEPVEWTGLAQATLADVVRLHCLGEIAQRGLVTVDARLEGLAAVRSGARLHVQARCSPVDARLDQVVGALAAELRLATSPSAIAFEITVDAERLRLSGAGQATLFDEQPHVTLARPLEISWKPDSNLFATGADVELPAEIPFHLRVESLDAPLDGDALRGRARLTARLTVDDSAGRVRWAGHLRDVAWRDWRAYVSLDDRVEFDVQGRLASQGREGSLSLKGEARDLPDWKRARIDAVAKLDDFPLEPFEELLGRDTRLVDLLGERMDLEVQAKSRDDGGHEVPLHAESEHLLVEGKLDVDPAAERVKTQGLTALWRVSPALVEGLARPVPVGLQIESLDTPLPRFDSQDTSLTASLLARFVSQDTSLTASLSIDDGALVYEGQRIEWHGLGAGVTAPKVGKDIQLRAAGEIAQGEERTTIDVHGNLADLRWNEEARRLELGPFHGELKLQGLPARAIGLPDDALGGRCDADFEATGGGEASQQGRLILSAPNLDARIPLRLGEEAVVEDATVRYRPPARWADGELHVTAPRLVIPLPRLVIPEDSPHADPRVEWRLADLRGEARLASKTLVVSGYTLADVAGRFDPEKFEVTGRVTGVADDRLRRGLAPPLDVQLEGKTNLARLPALDHVGVQVEGAVLKLRASARLESELRLSVTEPAVVDYELRPGVVEKLDLAAPVPLHAEVPRLEVPLRKLHLAIVRRENKFRDLAIVGRADISAPRIALRKATLADVKLTATAREELTVEGGGRITRPGRPRPFSLDARYRGQDSWDARVENLSLRLVEALAGGEGLVDAFGEEATFEIVREPQAAQCRRLRAPHLELLEPLDCALVDGLKLSRPATLRWTVTPAAWPAGDFALRAPAQVEVRIDELLLPFDPPLDDPQPAWERLKLSANLRVPALELQDVRSRQPLPLKQIQIRVTAGAEGDDTFNAAGDGRLDGGGVQGSVELDAFAGLLAHAAGRGSWGTKLRLPAPRGELRGAVTGHGNVRLDQVPAWLVDRLFGLDPYARTVLGETASATANWIVKQGNGPLHVRVDAPRAKASVDAKLTPAGVLLDKDLTAELTLTQELGALVLPKLGPFFRGLESAEHPVRVRIPPKGFLLPLERFDIRKVEVSTATLDIGRAVFNNAWLTDVLQLVTKARAPGGLTSAWFTPLDLELADGVIRYRKRVDLLTQENMHLASWGEVDIGNNRFDLTFAFMPEALRHHLGVSRARDGDALRIPVRGTIEKPKLVLGNTLADLAKIQLRDKALAQIDEPIGRAIAEAVLERLFSKALRGGAVPPATADPLPWAQPEEQPKEK